MKVGDLVRHKPTIFNENPRSVHVISELLHYPGRTRILPSKATLWVKLWGSSVPHDANMFEVINESR